MIMRLVWIMLLSAGLASCGGGGSSSDGTGGGGGGGTRQWTYMVYMGADNTLSDAAWSDLNEMETVGSNANIAIVAQVEFSSKYSKNLPTDTRRLYVQKDSNTNSVNLNGTSIGNVDMASPAQLTAFINWAKTNYPAQHYALVIWDHGAGWKAQNLSNPAPARGAVQDETSGTFMSLPDLAKGVSDSGLHFDVVNFDACLMAMYEVAYEFRTLTDYMVFSEESEPGAGDPYDTILAALAQTPTMSSRTLATTIVDKYYAFYQPDTRQSTTKSAVDMSKVDALDTAVVALAKELAADTGTNGVVASAQANTQKYSYPENHDLYHFCDYLKTNSTSTAVQTACTNVMTQVSSVVIDNKSTGTSMANSHGLAIYIPTTAQILAGDLDKYALLKCNLTSRASATGTWGAYINALNGGTSGAATGTGGFALALVWTKPDGTACDADLDLYVVEPDGKPYAPWMGQTSPNGFFSQESTVSGKSEEYYLANPTVAQGAYDFLVNYYASSASCTQALAHVLYLAPGQSSFVEIAGSPVTLSLTNPQPANCTSNCFYPNTSDWWYPGGLTRTLDGGTPFGTQALSIPGRSGGIVFKQKKSIVFSRLGF